MINDTRETINSLLPSASHLACLSAENLCDLVDIFASFFDIMFKTILLFCLLLFVFNNVLRENECIPDIHTNT